MSADWCFSSMAQSQGVTNRDVLEARYQTLSDAHTRRAPRPKNWGGFLLQPDQYEFWQGRESRLHDRLQYKAVKGGWAIRRLQP